MDKSLNSKHKHQGEHFKIYIWKFTVHVLLKPGLENFEHYFTGM